MTNSESKNIQSRPIPDGRLPEDQTVLINDDHVIFHTGLSNPVQAKETWGYVDVREGAHMFWWLYYADSPSASYTELPLVMWLQVGHRTKPSLLPCFSE